jgi:hypothetical protein
MLSGRFFCRLLPLCGVYGVYGRSPVYGVYCRWRGVYWVYGLRPVYGVYCRWRGIGFMGCAPWQWPLKMDLEKVCMTSRQGCTKSDRFPGFLKKSYPKTCGRRKARYFCAVLIAKRHARCHLIHLRSPCLAPPSGEAGASVWMAHGFDEISGGRTLSLNGMKIKTNLTNSNTASVLTKRQKYLMTKNELSTRISDRTTAKTAGRPLGRYLVLFFRSPTHSGRR